MQVFVEGKNCRVDVDGTTRQLGFFTTRTTRGLDSTQAEKEIRRKLEHELRSKILNNHDNPPEIIFGEFIEIDSETASNIPKTGYTWYPKDPSHQN